MVVALGAAGCGGGGSASADDPQSEYCKVAVKWAAHELTPADQSDPATMRSYWKGYTAFVRDAMRTAPARIDGAWDVYGGAILTISTPVLEKFDFSVDAIMSKGTKEEQAAVQPPPPNVQKAIDGVLGYEADVCAAQQPRPADVSFAGEQKPKAYCEAVGAMDEAFGSVHADGAKPKAVRTLLNSEELDALGQKQVRTAPAVIRDDVQKLDRFDRDEVTPMVAKFGYDVRRLLLTGSPQERAIFNHTDPSIRDASARVDAYTQQVCEG